MKKDQQKWYLYEQKYMRGYSVLDFSKLYLLVIIQIYNRYAFFMYVTTIYKTTIIKKSKGIYMTISFLNFTLSGKILIQIERNVNCLYYSL